MTASKEIAHHLKFQLRNLRWWLVAIVLLAFKICEGYLFQTTPYATPLHPYAAYIATYFILHFATKQHSLVGDKAFWMTRPITRTSLANSKVILVLTVCTLWLFGEWLGLVFVGIHPTLAALVQAEAIFLFTYFMLVCLLFQSFSNSFRKQLTHIAIIIVLIILTNTLNPLFPASTIIDILFNFFTPQHKWIGGLYVGCYGILLTSAVILLRYHYRFRATWAAAGLFSCAVLPWLDLRWLPVYNTAQISYRENNKGSNPNNEAPIELDLIKLPSQDQSDRKSSGKYGAKIKKHLNIRIPEDTVPMGCAGIILTDKMELSPDLFSITSYDTKEVLLDRIQFYNVTFLYSAMAILKNCKYKAPSFYSDVALGTTSSQSIEPWGTFRFAVFQPVLLGSAPLFKTPTIAGGPNFVYRISHPFLNDSKQVLITGTIAPRFHWNPAFHWIQPESMSDPYALVINDQSDKTFDLTFHPKPSLGNVYHGLYQLYPSTNPKFIPISTPSYWEHNSLKELPSIFPKGIAIPNNYQVYLFRFQKTEERTAILKKTKI